MTTRWPDGSLVVGDPHAEAARLQAETLGWCVWFGQFTRRYWAMPRNGLDVLVEARGTSQLIDAMARWGPMRQ